MVHLEDHAGAICFLMGASHHTALSLRPIDAARLENIPTILIDLCRSDSRLFTDIWQFVRCIVGVRKRRHDVICIKCVALIFAS